MLQPIWTYLAVGAVFVLLSTVPRVRGYRIALAVVGLSVIAVAIWF